MSEIQANGQIKRIPAPMIELPNHQGYLITMDDEDPNAIVDTTIRPADVLPRIQSEPVADLRGEQSDFQRGMEAFERLRGYRCLHWRDVLMAIHDLGYRRVAKCTIEQDAQPEAKS